MPGRLGPAGNGSHGPLLTAVSARMWMANSNAVSTMPVTTRNSCGSTAITVQRIARTACTMVAVLLANQAEAQAVWRQSNAGPFRGREVISRPYGAAGKPIRVREALPYGPGTITSTTPNASGNFGGPSTGGGGFGGS